MVQFFNDKFVPLQFCVKPNQLVLFDHHQPVSFCYKSTFTLKYVDSGQVDYQYAGGRVSLTSGNFVLISSGSRISTNIAGKARGVSLFFPAEFEKKLEPGLFEQPWPLVQSGLKNSLQTLLHSSSGENDSSSILLFHFFDQLLDYQNMIREAIKSLSYRRQETKREVFLRILEARFLLEQHYNRDISLDELSRWVGLSKFLMVRKFKETFELSPRQFLLKKRIEKASDLLKHSQLSISDISAACGFSNLHHFSKTFRKHTRFSPSGFRESNL